MTALYTMTITGETPPDGADIKCTDHSFVDLDTHRMFYAEAGTWIFIKP